MTKVESRPSKTLLGQYIFLVDINGHREEAHVAQALERLRSAPGCSRSSAVTRAGSRSPGHLPSATASRVDQGSRSVTGMSEPGPPAGSPTRAGEDLDGPGRRSRAAYPAPSGAPDVPRARPRRIHDPVLGEAGSRAEADLETPIEPEARVGNLDDERRGRGCRPT
jgi:hypothetical protein